MSAKDASAGAGDAGNIVALNADGKVDPTMLPAGVGADQRVVTASETLAGGALVNLWLDGSDLKARNADATTTGKPAHGFVNEGAAADADATVIFDGTISGLSGLTIGAEYVLSTTPGGVVALASAPAATGNLYQQVGVAVSATELVFEKGIPIHIAA